MAATLTKEFLRWRIRPESSSTEKYLGIFQITLDSSYDATNGEAVDFTSLSDFSAVDDVFIIGAEATGYVPQYDIADGAIRVFEAGADAAALDEVANTTDLSSVTVNVLVVGDPPA